MSEIRAEYKYGPLEPELPLSIGADEYHELPGESNSKLSVFIEDPRKYHYQFLSGEYVQPRKDHFDFGSAVHDILLLGLDKINIIPASVLDKTGAKRGNAWKEFAAENEGKTLMKMEDYRAVMRCVDAVGGHPFAGELLTSLGYTERPYAAFDADLGLTLRCRPDKLCHWRGKSVIVDLKTTTNTTASQFAKSIANFGYDRQEYFYRRVLEQCDIHVDAFLFIAVQVDRPHMVDCYTINAEWVASAGEQVETALKDLARRHRENDWESATRNSYVELAAPNYLRYRGDYQS